MSTRIAGSLLILAAAISAGGCGGSDSPAVPASPDTSGAATSSASTDSGNCAADEVVAKLCVAVSITGEATVSGSTSGLILADNCADFASGTASGLSKGGFQLPTELAPIDSVTITPSIKIKDYTGPGDYAGDKVTGLAGPPGLLVNLDEFNTRAAGSVAVVVAADGSGTATYTDIKNAAETQGVSGTLEFTCKDKG